MAERGAWIGDKKKGLWVREIRKLTESGHQVSLISTAFGVAVGLLTLESALGSGAVEVSGDPSIFGELLSYLELPNPEFNIVTP